MRHNTPVTTMAAAIALALALLVAVLLPADSPVHAADPVFVDSTDPITRSVEENTPPGVNIGNPISASDSDETGSDTAAIEFGNTLTYKLGGTDADKFDIDASTGQLITKAPLNFESETSYSVTVTVDDGETRATPCTACTQNVTISVSDDDDEAPAAPDAPTVVSGPDNDLTDSDETSTTSLKVIWHAPENKGDAITDYNVQYKKSTETTFGNDGVTCNCTTATIDPADDLEPDMSYDVRVRAINGEGTGPWSLVGTGSTNKAGNSPPTFNAQATINRRVDENTPAGRNIEGPVTASDGDSVNLTYWLEGSDAELFGFDTRTGQIRTKASLNHEDARCGYVAADDGVGSTTTCSYNVTVTVSDGAGGSDAAAVSIVVSDRTEVPSPPARPTVRATANSSTSLDVSWDPPANMGPAITQYQVRYRTGGGGFLDDDCGVVTDDNCQTISGTSVTILGLEKPEDFKGEVAYEVQVRARDAGEGGSAWSASGTGRTSKANQDPIFDARPDDTQTGDYTITRTVDEDVRVGHVVTTVRANDPDGDSLTYNLAAVSGSEPDLEKFEINESNGQLRTKVQLNHEDSGCDYVNDADPTVCTYDVMVEVRDGLDDDRVKTEDESHDDRITVRINVRDVDEPPAAPTVTVTSPTLNTTLIVTWDVPENTGPPIAGYDVQYRKGTATFLDDNCLGTPGTDNCNSIPAGTTATTITGLEADTSYSVQVRATDASEGAGAWSRLVTVKTNKADNNAPGFAGTPPTSLSVVENTTDNRQTVRDVGTVSADPNDDSSRVTYKLEGSDANSFTIDSGTGLIKTRVHLNFEEAPDCAPTDDAVNNCYLVRVKIEDDDGGSASHALRIDVTDADEPPPTPAAPRVTATKDSGWSLDVTWNEPRNVEGPPITDYDIQYRKVGESDFVEWPHGTEGSPTADNTERSATINTIGTPPVHLEPRTQYEVQVMATNDEGDSAWSPVGRGTTGGSNTRPRFDSTAAVVMLSVTENTSAGRAVGSPVSASDADGNGLTYSLEGPGSDSFTIVSSSGQIRTRVALNYEERISYSVTVKVNDRQNKANSVAAKSVTITVSNAEEPPSAPTAPTVAGIPGSTDSVRVTWDEPANTGPAITDYDVHYREVGAGGFVLWNHNGVDRSTIITNLQAGTRYEVQVRSRSPEGTSGWSRSGSGMPNPDVANRNPAFSSRTVTLSVPENTLPSNDIGNPVAATDQDGDPLTYALEGTDADSFDILSTTVGGQIRTSAALNFEEKSSYSVTVRVTDGRGGTDAANVTIRVTDVDGEAPETPLPPAVTAISSMSLQVTWEAPENTGPPITDYDYRYRNGSASWTQVINTTITDTTVTIEGLTASTFYDVEVRATNAEGTSDWSNSGNGTTNAPGANNPPVFTEGASATRSVSATSPAGTNIGEPVEATDADTGDTLTYSLEGRDAALFDINDATGQLLTKSGITLIVDETYTLTVAADDGVDIARISVEITATAAPPNNVPVFSDGASTTRSVRDDAASGAPIGNPVRATDADAGDTITYSLEGTDAASFGIVASSGQIQTSAALDASTKSTYSVTVRATDSNGGSATIAVTITVTPRPVTFGCATNGAVSDTSNTGLISDCEALMASRNLLEGNTGRLNWSPATPINQWEGVSLRGTPSRVTFLDLSSKRLDGTVPADLGRLPMLRWLNLRSNDLSGSIPSELGNLTRLERLLLHNNRLSGPIPDLLGRLRSLKMLWLSGRDMALTGNLPSWLNSMSSLESLSVWGNDLSGPIPTLTGMTSLELLKLQSNNFTGGVPAWFGDMNGPAILYLHDNELTGRIPANLGRNTGVIRLWLDRNNLNGEIPSELGGMTGLRTLNLRDNQLTGTIPSELGNLGSLNQLRLHNNQLTGTIPSALANLSNVTQMWLSGNQLTGSIPTALGGMPRLRDLNLRANDLSGAIPVELGNLRDTLTRLRIGGTIQDGVETRGNTGLTGCVPRSLAGATDADDLRLAGSAGISLCP